MDASKHGADAILSSTQLVQYEDDEDNDDKIAFTHSDHPTPPREAPGEDVGRNNTKGMSVESDSAAQLDARAEMDIVEAEAGNEAVCEDDRGLQGDIDGEARGDVYTETSLPEEFAVQQSHGVHEGVQMAARAQGASGIPADTVHPQGANSPTQGVVGSGNDYTQDHVQERGIEETALEESVHGIQTEPSNFSAMQQLQLRAQILVYGDLIKGQLPAESMMSSAFSDVEEAPGQEAQTSSGSGGWNWEKSWQEAVEKLKANHKGDAIMTEGDIVNAVTDNLEPGTPSASPSRVVEETLGETVIEPEVMPQAADRADISVADLDGHPADINGDLSVLTVNLDAVVENIAATVSLDTSVVKDTRLESQGTRSPSLDPWLKPQSSQQTTPVPAASPGNAPNATWDTASTWVSSSQVSTPISGSQLPTAEIPTAVGDGLPATGSPVGTGNADPEEGSRKRKGPARERKTPAGRSVGTTPRPSRAKNARVSQVAAPEDSLDPNVPALAGPSQLSHVVSATAGPLTEGIPATPNSKGKKREPKVTASLHTETQNWLEQAKVSFEEAVSAANSAAEQVDLVNAQNTPQNRTPGKEAQITSAVAAVNAAASVAKAAADAAKVAYEAALQASLIVADGVDMAVVEKFVIGNNRGDKDGGLGGRRSAIAAAKEEARKRAKATPSSKTTPQSTDAVLRAAKLMADAATRAGEVLAKTNFGATPHTGLQSPVVQDDVGGTVRGRSRKDTSASKTPKPGKRTEVSPTQAKDVKVSMKKGARKKGKDALNVSATKTPSKKVEDGQSKSDLSPEKHTRRQLDETMLKSSNTTVPSKVILEGQIVEGSLIEVMNDEPGLRGGWFSGRVLQMRAREAYVQYDEILTDEGDSQLKEWFPLDGPSEGTEPGRPGIRVISADSIARDEGRRKRRRTSFGMKSWSVGDRVDAFVQDGWWEGIVKEVDEDDENKIKVHFPGEGDTSIVKSWNLRPSFVWKNGRWEQWSAEAQQQQILVGGGQVTKKQKVASPKAQARKSRQKVNPPSKGGDATADVSRHSRSRKTTDLATGKIVDSVESKLVDSAEGKMVDSIGGNLPSSLTTRNSPRQKITPKRKAEPVKMAITVPEVSIPPPPPPQVSTRVSTRTRPVAQDAVVGSTPATGSNPDSSVSPVRKKRETPAKKKGSSPSKLQNLTTNGERAPSSVIKTSATRGKAKAEAPPQTRRSTRVS